MIKITIQCDFCRREQDTDVFYGFRWGASNIIELVPTYDNQKVHKHLCCDCFKSIGLLAKEVYL